MSMDVIGRNPANEKGKYFRSNVWHWRPLAQFILEHCSPEITDKCKGWQYNDGDGLGEIDAYRLHKELLALLASGEVHKYCIQRDATLKALPDVTCEICSGTGVRNDAIARAGGFAGTKCNGCSGAGHRRPIATYYPLSPQDVQEFCEFLGVCGGFQIF